MKRFQPRKHEQRGAVLLIALVVLLVVTMLVLAGSSETLLQIKMASSMQDHQVGLQAAEAGLRAGERDVFERFLDGTIYDLKGVPASGTYASFEGSSRAPEYTITTVSTIRTSTEVGMPVDDEGALVSVESFGFGAQVDNDASPITYTHLRSTVVVEQ